MKNYDVIVIGAATSGAFFARRMAEKGYSVKVIEKLSKEKLGRRLDIFHMGKTEFKTFGLPEVHEGDPYWAFEFSNGYTAAPSGKYPKLSVYTVVGMHMYKYIELMNDWAKEKGAEFEYGASFDDFIFKDGKIAGVNYSTADKKKKAYGKVVVDCSGTNSAARVKIPEGYGVENFAITPEDVFYVVLRYVKFKNEKDYLNGSCTGYPFYKSWIAPQTDPKGAIIGIGACHSYDFAENVYKQFEASVPLPEHEITRFERGTTPYTRPPYSFVGDNFIVSGDAACLTKPMNGEGVTSSMVQMEIAAEVLDKALKNGDTSKKALWDINVRYSKEQGAEFANLRALLIKVVHAVTKEEFEYVFKKDIVSEKLLSFMGDSENNKLSAGDIIRLAGKVLAAIFTGKIKSTTLKAIKEGVSLGGKLKKLYKNYPVSPDGYDEWVKSADSIWKKIGKMA